MKKIKATNVSKFAHTSNSQRGMGTYTGTGVRNPQGTIPGKKPINSQSKKGKSGPKTLA